MSQQLRRVLLVLCAPLSLMITAANGQRLPTPRLLDDVPQPLVKQDVPRPADVATIRLYNTLATLTQSQQRVLVSSLPPERRAPLWQYNLDRFVDRHPNLTPEQHTLLRRLRAFITPANFAVQPGSPEWSAKQTSLTELSEAASSAFSPQLQWEALHRIGEGEIYASSAAMTSALALPRKVEPEPNTAVICDCHDGFYDCGPLDFYVCVNYRNSCVRIPANCGVMYEEACDGLCF